LQTRSSVNQDFFLRRIAHVLFAILSFAPLYLAASSVTWGEHSGAAGNVLATLPIRGGPSNVSNPACVLYIDPELWKAREKSITRFLDSHLPSPQWRPLEVWGKDALGDGRTASGSSDSPMSPVSTELRRAASGVIVAADNAVQPEELAYLRKNLPRSEGWREYHWMIAEPPADGVKEFHSTEVVVFSRLTASPNATGSRWGMPRLLNPFARPLRTTDYYGSGDANLDGTFDSSDLIYTEDIVGQILNPTERADVNGDGAVDSQDITAMEEVLSGSRDYLPGWWDRLETREERNGWVNKMLAIDKTDGHAYQYPFFVCREFSSVLVLNNIGYDGSFLGEPSEWLSPGRFNLPMYYVILATLPHAITGILVGDNPLEVNSWRFIEPQSDSDGRQWFRPGERIFIQATSRFSSLGGMSSGRTLVIFELDGDGSAVLERADPELVTTRLSDVTVHPATPATGQRVSFTARTCREGVTAVTVILRPAGTDAQGTAVPLYDDGFHDDGASGDGLWGGSATVEEPANILVDLSANLVGGGEITYQQASWFSAAEGKWYVSPSGNDSDPGSYAEPFQTIAHAVQVAFPGDTIVAAPGEYPESVVINKGALEIAVSGSPGDDVSVSELRVEYGTGTIISGLSCQFAGAYHASAPIFAFCGIEELFESVDAQANVKNCRVKEVQAWSSSVFLRGAVVKNPGGCGVAINCPRTSKPSLVPLEILNCTIVNSKIGLWCTADDEYYPCTLKVINSVLWDNVVDIDYDYPRIRPVRCAMGNRWPGEGDNISEDPLFADPSANDYSLASGSPCIDAGDSTRIPGEFQRDIAGKPRISGSQVDIGAYECPEGTSASAAVASVQCSLAAESPSGYETINPALQSRVSGRAYGTWAMETSPYIFDGPVYVREFDTLTIEPGVEVRMEGKKLVVIGRLLALGTTHLPIAFVGGKGLRFVLSEDGSEMKHCIIEGGDVTTAGASYTFWDPYRGGGVYCWRATPVFNACTIRDNQAMYGGGVYLVESNAVFINSIVAGNAAKYGPGGGVCCSNGSPEITNCIIAGNLADFGGGLYHFDGTLRNSTVVGNLAGRGGGLYECDGLICNCIIWGNSAPNGAQLYDSKEPIYSCIQDFTGEGEGNTAEDPGFVDPDGADDDPYTYNDNDYRLSPASPCIDAGRNEGWMWETLDPDGNPRIFPVKSMFSWKADMGAHEYVPPVFPFTACAGVTGGGIQVIWTSRPGDTFNVSSRADLLTGEWMKEDIVLSQSLTTSWTDAATATIWKFYRIELK